MLSLVSSANDSQLKEMRLAGCDRREEVEALLAGVITEELPAEVAEIEAEAAKAAASKSDIEESAEREDEIKELLARARERGIEADKKRKEEEEEKAKGGAANVVLATPRRRQAIRRQAWRQRRTA